MISDKEGGIKTGAEEVEEKWGTIEEREGACRKQSRRRR